jgi:hypothetical protein
MLVYGGWNSKDYTSDIFHIDLDRVEGTGFYAPSHADLDEMRSRGQIPAGRNGHTMTLIENHGIYMFGGWDCTRFSNADNSYATMWKLTPEWRFETCDLY